MTIINLKKTYLGIEFGSTRVKAILIDSKSKILAKGEYVWENSFVDSFYTYSYEEIKNALKTSYSNLKKEFEEKYKQKLTTLGAIGISAMMHGYLPLDQDFNPLINYRTWRNNNAQKEAKELTNIFNYPIPARWSIAHLYYAYKHKEKHFSSIAYLMTLSSYVAYLLTGKIGIGIGEASGVFPLNEKEINYDEEKINIFNNLIKNSLDLHLILPKIYKPNEILGTLTIDGLSLLDESKDLDIGIKIVPPEGDSSTGLIGTNSLNENTCNISAGTSIFSMSYLKEIPNSPIPFLDIVFSPLGKPIGMIHINNCTSDLNSYISLFKEVFNLCNIKEDKDFISKLFKESLKGDLSCNDILIYPYVSNENIEGISKGMPLLIKKEGSKLTLNTLMLASIYSSFYSLTKKLNELNKDKIFISKYIIAHGGIFKTKDVASTILSSILNLDVYTSSSSSEGGAYGMALLAEYIDNTKLALNEFLKTKVFKNLKYDISHPSKEVQKGYKTYSKNLDKYIAKFYDIKKDSYSDEIDELKEKVLKANLDLVKNKLVLFTWGNVSMISKNRKYIAIKPSGVPYDTMKKEDIIITDINGNIVEGNLNPSSDLPTHLEIYKAHKEIKAIVHTHSTFATSFAQAGENIVAYGTTHADYFYGDIPCARSLKKNEIEKDYEKNTGKVINEALKNRDVMSIPGILCKNHGVFAWGYDADNAVYNATVIEEVAKMAYLTKTINPNVKRVSQDLLDKHYKRKHGKDAYYGQNK